jgi:hypothetical protein
MTEGEEGCCGKRSFDFAQDDGWRNASPDSESF